MREFFELINEFPWTAVFLCFAIFIALGIISGTFED